jgi:hypothetical protein
MEERFSTGQQGMGLTQFPQQMGFFGIAVAREIVLRTKDEILNRPSAMAEDA